jgi:hypothetical protein
VTRRTPNELPLRLTNYTPTNAPYFHFLFFNPYICFSPYKAIFRGLVVSIDINNGCKIHVDYEPPEDGLVRVETCVGVKE